ncbi:hypothetical protein PF008_g8856 [Phytophthora fragariae]|uniref:Uncharacterized protein n=1 Tax=Phytophthora fragariae TaxID=53985 RepID=A0A6G0RYX5_9STRA|nr:hypothetical protein PF008_g8856 [Phytophthora fragariae]
MSPRIACASTGVCGAQAPADPIDAEVPRPANVKYAEECEVPEGNWVCRYWTFKCVRDCFMDTCSNTALANSCTPIYLH